MQLIKQTDPKTNKKDLNNWANWAFAASRLKCPSQDDVRWAETVLTHMHKAKMLQGICNASMSHRGEWGVGGGEGGLV